MTLFKRITIKELLIIALIGAAALQLSLTMNNLNDMLTSTVTSAAVAQK